MKAIMLSIQPQWVAKIFNGEKTIEIRKTMPKCELPIKVYIYCTNQGRPLVYGQENACVSEHYTQTYNISRKEAEKIWDVLNGKVVAEFTLNKVDTIEICDPCVLRNGEQEAWWWFKSNACLNCEEIMSYIGYGNDHDGWGNDYSKGYAWHIDDLKIYDEPKELSEFRTPLDKPKCGYSSCGSYDYSYCKWLTLNCEKRIIKKPPQSWCYVEELEENND